MLETKLHPNGLNADWATRDTIIFGEAGKPQFKYFETLTMSQISQLHILGYLTLTDTQHESPNVGEFMQFMQRWGEYPIHAIGYAVNIGRSDYRVSITGLKLEHDAIPPALHTDFVNTFSRADEFTAEDTHLYCWFD